MEAIISVGIDIGTTTTQLVFSELLMENTAGYFAVPHYAIVSKKLLYRGRPWFTPLIDEKTIDAKAVNQLVLQEYRVAGIEPKDVGAGAVIITGESARKDNAEALIQSLSSLAGEFVVSSAGPGLESVIAGKGSGAHADSEKYKRRVLNLDIGGGTTNAVLFDCGKTVSTGCVDIGGRAVRTGWDGVVEKIAPAARRIADVFGVPLYEGMRDVEALRQLCRRMAELIEQMIGLMPPTELLRSIRTPHSDTLQVGDGTDAICFSGGVAEAVYGRLSGEDVFRFFDIGLLLGQAVADSAIMSAYRVIEPEETLRATVVGAGSYATALSGSTISVQRDVLPLKNLPVLRLDKDAYQSLCAKRSDDLRRRIGWLLEQTAADALVLAMQGERDPAYISLCALAESIADAYRDTEPSVPIIVALEEDTAKALGQLLRQRTDRAVLSIDGIYAEEHDYIDIGVPIAGDVAVPVVVKTLAFGAE